MEESTPITQTPDDRAREPTAMPQTERDEAPAQHHTAPTVPENNQQAMSTAQMHATGSIADMSAAWSAKVVAAANEQARPVHPQLCFPLAATLTIQCPADGQKQDGRGL